MNQFEIYSDFSLCLLLRQKPCFAFNNKIRYQLTNEYHLARLLRREETPHGELK